MLITIKKIKNLIDPKFKSKLILYFFFAVILMFLEVIGIALLFPIVKFITDGELAYKSIIQISKENFLLFSSIFLFFVFAIKNLLFLFLNYLQYKFLGKIHLNLAYKLIKNYLEMQYKYFVKSNTSIMSKNIDEVQGFITYLNALLNVILEILITIAILILLLKVNFFFTIIASLVILFVSFLFYYSTKLKLSLYSKERVSFGRKFLKELLETFNSIREIKTYKKENKFLDLNILNLSKQIDISIKTNIFKAIPKPIYEQSFVLLICIFLIFLGFSNIALVDTLPTLSIFMAAAIRLIPSGNKILNQYQLIRYHKLSLEILNSELKKHYLSNKVEKNNYKYLEDFKLDSINIRNVDFYYKDKKILENVNLDFNKGKIYGIIGPSGSGKTTLANLLLGLLKQKKGQILVNNKYNLDEIKNNYHSLLPQKIFMFDNTIKSNIAFDYSTKNINENKLEECITKSKLKEFIYNLDNNLNEFVGENAVKLSGGQAQRLAIARAIYHDAQLIIFDEPTSSLDKENEREIFESISSLKDNKILIVISHSDEITKYIDHKIIIKNKDVILN